MWTFIGCPTAAAPSKLNRTKGVTVRASTLTLRTVATPAPVA
ncbi:MAG: hypothetical protein AABO58_00965 [Acidobacteriota bacterium]